MSTTDLWTESGHDWRQLVGMPTLRVAQRGDTSTFRGMTDVERRERLAFAIRAAMAGRTAQEIAVVIEPKRSKETIARWARGETVPSALDVGPLARALGVRAELLIDPPALPAYPLEDYLIDAAESGVEEGLRRALVQEHEARGTRSPSPARQPRGSGAGRG
jgi:transcriptional regulator with XRE-family HTH domain